MHKITKHQQSRSESNSPSQSQKLVQKKLSQYRDYISMRSTFRLNNLKTQKLKKQKQTKPLKHSLQTHQHLQPDQPFPNDDDEQHNLDRDEDPISLLNNYTKQNYLKFLKTMKQNVTNQKPYTCQPQSLLQTLSSKHFNICLYGFGSKITYIRHLISTYLSDHNIWEINGYKNSLNDKKIYNNFSKFLKQTNIATKLQKITKQDQLNQYRACLTQYAKSKKKQLIIVFHCLDSINYLNQQSQQSLSLLFSLPSIKLICSIDSIKIASIWHPRVKTRYNFRFFQINTSKPYIQQQMFRPNTTDIRQQADQATMNIYKSLNSNQKRILKLFAKKQLQNAYKQDPQYYTLQSLLDQCIQNVILSNDTQLRQNLLQLIDHRVVVPIEKTDHQRTKKCYTIKCNKGMLQTIFKDRIQD